MANKLIPSRISSNITFSMKEVYLEFLPITCIPLLCHIQFPYATLLKAGGEGDNRGWDGWMASLTRWTWVWESSERWCWTGQSGVLQFIGLQRVGHDWVTELNWCYSTLYLGLLLAICLLLLEYKLPESGYLYLLCPLMNANHLDQHFVCIRQSIISVEQKNKLTDLQGNADQNQNGILPQTYWIEYNQKTITITGEDVEKWTLIH